MANIVGSGFVGMFISRLINFNVAIYGSEDCLQKYKFQKGNLLYHMLWPAKLLQQSITDFMFFSDRWFYMLPEGFICVVSTKIIVWGIIFNPKESEIFSHYLPLLC